MARGHLLLAPETDALRAQFEELAAQCTDLLTSFTDDEFQWQAEPTAWSAAQCLDHMNVVARGYLPSLDEAIADGIRSGLYGKGPFTYNWIGRLLVALAEPPPSVRMKTRRTFAPDLARSRPHMTAAFMAYQVQLIDRLRQANGLDLSRVRVRSPIFTWLRVPLGSGFAWMVAHERRHLWQMRRVVEKARIQAGG